MTESSPEYDLAQARTIYAQASAVLAQQYAEIEQMAARDFPAFLDAHQVDLVLTPIITQEGRIAVSAQFVARKGAQ